MLSKSEAKIDKKMINFGIRMDLYILILKVWSSNSYYFILQFIWVVIGLIFKQLLTYELEKKITPQTITSEVCLKSFS